MAHKCGTDQCLVQECSDWHSTGYFSGERAYGFRVKCMHCNCVSEIKPSEAGAILCWAMDDMVYTNPDYDTAEVKTERYWKG